jgi:hypothetical protein
MTPRTLLPLMAVFGAAGALVLGTLETDAAGAYWHARPSLETVGPAVLLASLLSLLVGSVGLVVARVRDRRTPAVDSPRAVVRSTAWTGWLLVGAGGAFGVVLAGELVGLMMIATEGGCGDATAWCGLGTALLAYGAGIAVTVLGAVGGALLGWSGRAAAGAGRTTPAAAPVGGYGPG